MEFGWWDKDDEGKKWQICVHYHGGNVAFARKHGHHTSWEDIEPTDAMWDRLLSEAERRLPRRLMSRKEFDRLRALRPE